MTLGSHQATRGKSHDWITPREIIEATGPYFLDPCAADPRPWDCAQYSISKQYDGLRFQWKGCVWLNPPFDIEAKKWVQRLAEHGDGVALLHARTETKWFLPLWKHAAAILFLKDRIHFHYPDGRRAARNSGAPPILAAFGEQNIARLKLPGYLVTQWRQQ